MPQPTRLDYCQYLLSSPINYTLTHLADHSQQFSHDMINRYLAGERIRPRLVWEHVKPHLAVTSLDPVSVGWNGNALLVYDAGVVDFYGGEQPALASVPSMPPRQYRSRAFKKYEETLDVMKRNADGSLMKRGIGVKGLRFSTIEEVYVTESADLTTQLRLFTIILLRPLPEIEVDDFIFRNTGATEGNPPMDLPPERYQVKGFGEWGDRYKQVLYCVRVRGDGEADALAGAHSPLRVRN